ncbi:hypothetical protein [Anaerophilus nitritogenes]|uniref:hypothetical protein n=1 Tax=Anaerophilus nitritogenes TaxID=2498136 RepID=UPI00101DED96|nr:hypothetical protein [Anaerophilus nitritogenes]
MTIFLISMLSVSSYGYGQKMTIKVENYGDYPKVIIKDFDLTYYKGSRDKAVADIDLTNISGIPSNAKVKRIVLGGRCIENVGNMHKEIRCLQTDTVYSTQYHLDNVRNLDSNLKVKQKWKVMFWFERIYDRYSNSGTWKPEVEIYLEP